MKKLLYIISLVLICSNVFAQQRDINTLLDQTLRNRGLTREDISIPIEFFSTAEKNPTNESKLILPLVKDMMTNPLRSMTWLDSVSEIDKMQIGKLTANMFGMLGYKQSESEEILYQMGFKDLNGLISDLEKTLIRNRTSRLELISKLSKYDKGFLAENLLSIIDEGNEDFPNESDILQYNNRRDSSIITTRKIMDLLNSLFNPEIKKDARNNLRSSSYSDLYYIMQINEIVESLIKRSDDYFEINNDFVKGEFYYYSDRNGIRIAIGGPGKNIYTGSFDFIIDLGGDDIYNIDRPPLGKEGVLDGGCQCIIDLSGNDYYTTSSDFALAGGLFSSSFIFDKEGDDFYESKGSGNLGTAIGGLGLLYDEKGNDTYKGISFSIGAGCFGVGLLVDREGNDFYIANSYSQGFGMTEGVGAIIDNKGNDSYLVDSRSVDIGRYNDHYVSMCQGYGLGLRPFYAGGIGLIIEGEGNDIYNTDIFGQGGAYWYSLGAIVDKSGHDKYNSYQYGQGAGIHLAVGLLKDYDGWDFYQSDGVSQGCGHDFGYGMLWDVKGNDNYSAYALSQGAGNADGIVILIYENGTNDNLNKY